MIQRCKIYKKYWGLTVVRMQGPPWIDKKGGVDDFGTFGGGWANLDQKPPLIHGLVPQGGILRQPPRSALLFGPCHTIWNFDFHAFLPFCRLSFFFSSCFFEAVLPMRPQLVHLLLAVPSQSRSLNVGFHWSVYPAALCASSEVELSKQKEWKESFWSHSN